MSNNQSQHQTKRPHKRWVSILLTVLKSIAIPVLCFIALIGGAIGGYVLFGKQPLSDVWSMQTWKHLFELVFSNG